MQKTKKIDYSLVLLPLLFTIFGLVMIYEASNITAYASFSDKYHFVKEQGFVAVIGFIFMFICSKINYKNLVNFSVPALVITLLSLILVLIPGIGIKILGARRWLNIGFTTLQPSELAKLSMVLYLSSWLINKEAGKFLPFLTLLGLIVGLVILQPDLGTAVILTIIFLVIYFLSSAPISHFLVLLPLCLFSVIIVAVISPYRYQRLLTFIDPSHDPLGSSYHIRQVLISLGSGGFFGIGIGASRQKYQYLPEATTDSIFAIIAEEFGFVGSSILILAFLLFLYRIFLIISHAPDNYAYLLASGIMILISSQIFINLGAMVALFPLTGVPLPFISYGGSNLVVTLASIGILLNISKYSSQKRVR